MRKFLLILSVCVCSGCASMKGVEVTKIPEVKTVAETCAGVNDNLVYEHVTPYTIAVAKNAKKNGLPNPGANVLPSDWMSDIVEMMKTPGWKPLMDNAPEVGWSTAGIVSAINGTWYGIVPGLVGIPFRSFQKVVEANFETQEKIRSLDNQLMQASIVSGNQVELERVYLPKHAKSVDIVGTDGVKYEVKGYEEPKKGEVQ